MSPFLIVLVPIPLAVLIVILLTTLHELGHAIPMILLTRGKVTVYLGSYGDTSRSIRLASRWIDIWFLPNPLKWKGGLCVPTNRSSVAGTVIYMLAGPLAPLLVVGGAYYLIYPHQPHWIVEAFLLVTLLFAAFSLFRSLIPRRRAIRVHGGNITYNDGYLIMMIYRLRRHWSAINNAVEEYTAKRYDMAAAGFLNLISLGVADEYIYRLGILSLFEANDLENTLRLVERFSEIYEFDSHDFAFTGLIHAKLENYEASLLDYDQSLEIAPYNTMTLNNRGYTLNLMERYESAIVDFDLAIELQPKMAYAYNNRGLALIRLGRVSEGLADIERSLELDPDNAYAHRNLGIYHYDRGEIPQAVACFERSRELDPQTHLVETYLQQATQALAGFDRG